MAGGFFRPGHEEEEVPQNRYKRADQGGGRFFAEGEEPDETDNDHGGGGFLVEEGGDDEGGGFIAEDTEEPTEVKSKAGPVSLQMLHKSTDGAMHDEDDHESDGEVIKAPVRRPTKPVKRPPPAKRHSISKSTPKRKLIAASRSTSASEEDEGSMSGLSDVSPDIGAFSGLPERRASSPQVVITPHKTNIVAPTNGRRSTRKATPVKSPYFSSQGKDNEEDDEEDDDDEDDESENEVILPRRTTARTRRAV
jgi:xeroderma pigmentosum group C-complementing protein